MGLRNQSENIDAPQFTAGRSAMYWLPIFFCSAIMLAGAGMAIAGILSDRR